MQTAYTTAAGQTPPDDSELATGSIGRRTLAPGLYAWPSAVTSPTVVTISGNSNDTWIFQIAGNLTISAAKNIIPAGRAQTKIFAGK